MFYQKSIYNFNASLMIFFFFTKLTKEKNNKNKKEDF